MKHKFFFISCSLIFFSYFAQSQDINNILINQDPTQLAIQAALYNWPKTLNQALLLGAKKDYRDPHGNNLLLLSVRHRSERSTDQLLKDPHFQKNIHHQNEFQENALMLACYNGHEKLVKKLLEQYKMDPNIQDKSGSTALHFAIRKNYINIAKTLIKHGANPTIQDHLLLTPIHYFLLNCENNMQKSSRLKKIILQCNEANNTQLHLFAMIKAHELSKRYHFATAPLFLKLMKKLSQKDVKLWQKNSDQKTAIEIAYETYCHAQKEHELKKINVTRAALEEQRQAFWTFLEYYLPTVPFSREPLSLALELDIETTIYEVLKKRRECYSSIEHLNTYRQYLHDNPTEIKFLWRKNISP